jgi:meso-butanediol dehydrogenase/(S,S)-butanediol dehydrogenase/diacetyl reductase
MLRFQQKVVIVTGAASGIGAATARRFSSEGGCVALVDRNEVDLANVAVDLPKDLTLAHTADVSDSKAVDAMVETVVKRFGRLDVLVNNAGIFEGGDPIEITDEQWRKVMSTDADGVFYGCRMRSWRDNLLRKSTRPAIAASIPITRPANSSQAEKSAHIISAVFQ